MPETTSPLLALVGYKRHKLALMGGVHVLAVRDGHLRIINRKDVVVMEAEVADCTARLMRTRSVDFRAGGRAVVLFGVSTTVTIPSSLHEIAVREGRDDAEVIGPADGGIPGVLTVRDVQGTAAVGRAISEALRERGVPAG